MNWINHHLKLNVDDAAHNIIIAEAPIINIFNMSNKHINVLAKCMRCSTCSSWSKKNKQTMELVTFYEIVYQYQQNVNESGSN